MRYRDYFFNRFVRRWGLRAQGVAGSSGREDVTVIIGVKNRCDYRIVNALKSLRCQDYDRQLIRIVLVDYDSSQEMIEKFREICARFDARYLRLDNKPVWNKSHCLNIAIRQADTKYLMSSDVDVFFEKNYISACVRRLRDDPFQVLISSFYNTPSGLVDGEIDVLGEYGAIKKLCGFQKTELGLNGALNPGINFSLTRFYQHIRGYDEYYTLWGSEDLDLIKRFALSGLKVTDISANSSWIHQCHEKHEGVNAQQNFKEKIAQNKQYVLHTHTVERNDADWGIPEKK